MSSQQNFLENINKVCEETFTLVSILAKELGCEEESVLAAKRVFSYNPNSQKVLQIFPQFKNPILEIEKIVEKNGQLLKKESKNDNLWVSLGFCYLILGDFPNAFAAYAHSLRVNENPKDPLILYALGVVYGHYSYWENSFYFLSSLLEKFPKFPYLLDINYRLGIISRNNERYLESIEFFEFVLHNPPKNLLQDDIELQIGYTYQLMGNFNETKKIYTDLYKKFPKNLKVIQNYSYFIFLKQNISNYDYLDNFFNTNISLFPKDSTLLLMYARYLMKKDDLNNAYSQYKYSLSYCSDSPYFWCGLGFLYVKNQQLKDALISYQRASFLKPDLYQAWYNIGLLFEKLEDFQSALNSYENGKHYCPNFSIFNERIKYLTSNLNQNPLQRFPDIIDIDDEQIFIPIPLKFAREYLSAVPYLPSDCFKNNNIKDLSNFATIPKSYFQN